MRDAIALSETFSFLSILTTLNLSCLAALVFHGCVDVVADVGCTASDIVVLCSGLRFLHSLESLDLRVVKKRD